VRVAITTDLLARLRSLDDLLELALALGFSPRSDELSPTAQERLGLGGRGLGIRRAAIIGRHEALVVYGAVMEDASRASVALAVERLARATPGERHLLLILDSRGAVLAAAIAHTDPTGIRARQLRILLDRPSAVAAEILSGLTPRADDTALSLSLRIADALADEGLTARFFREFTRQHARAAEALTGVPRATAGERRDLTLVILTRVLFLYFVQAKGWLAGRSDFLPSLLDTALRTGRPFHRQAFEPLCFGALSTPAGSRTGVARALGVPFLNGGLFERHALERRFPAAELPDATWRELFDDLFERFHFTVREQGDDAIDPEMLGRVFEGLMAADRRRSSGSYYTPRDLLQRTVAAGLEAALDGRDVEAVRTLRILDPAVGSGAFLLEALAQLERRRAAFNPGEPPQRRRRDIVRDNLFGVDQDPIAVRLAELRLWLSLVADDTASWHDVAPLPNLDLNLRQGDSLLSPLDVAGGAYVPAATGKLRAVAERKAQYFAASGRDKAALARSIRADERVIAGASADAAIASLTAHLADVASAAGRDLFGQRARRDPATARRVVEWRQRRRELLAVRRRLADDDVLPFFSYEVHFGDVLGAGGFDLVIGNPPWVRGERLPVSTRAMLTSRYRTFRATAPGRRGFAHLPDLSVAFVERALQLLRPDGVLAFLLPAKLLRAGYAGPLRALLREQATVLQLDDRAHAPASGFAATVFPMICVVRRRPPDPVATAHITLTGAGAAVSGHVRQRDLSLDPDNPRAMWLALPGEMAGAVRTALDAGPRLGSHFRPRLGVKTGANAVFLRALSRADELPSSHRRPALQGRDIAPFRAEPSAALLAALDDAGNPCRSVPPDVAAFLRPHASLLARRTDARAAPPWALFRTDLLRSRWIVLWRDIAPRLEAVALERSATSPVPLNTCYGVAVPDDWTAHWLSAWLNSAPLRTLASALAERASGGVFRFSAGTIAALPLPRRTDDPDVRALAEIGRAARHQEEYDADALDAHALRALDLDARTAAGLWQLDAALRRSAGGDC
jgi:hypothetical protein